MSGQLLTLKGVVDSWQIADSEHERDLCVRWLADQIRAKRITARKIRRRWYLNAADQAAALEAFANRRVQVDAAPSRPRGLSAASQKLRSA